MQLRDDFPTFQAAGLGVVAITMGSPRRNSAFRQEQALPYPLLSDPTREAYAALGVTARFDMLKELNPSSLKHFVQDIVTLGGDSPGKQDAGQMGATFVIDTTGVIRYAFRNALAHEQPPLEALLRAARPAPV